MLITERLNNKNSTSVSLISLRMKNWIRMGKCEFYLGNFNSNILEEAKKHLDLLSLENSGESLESIKHITEDLTFCLQQSIWSLFQVNDVN